MKIRIAKPEDADNISGLIVFLADKYIACDFSAAGRASLLCSMTADSIRKYLSEGFRYHVAEDPSGELIGVVGTRRDTHLYHLFIAEPAQRRGLAQDVDY